MTREEMIHVLLSEQRDDISADIERSNIAAQLKADGETIERLTAERAEIDRMAAALLAYVESMPAKIATQIADALRPLTSQRDAALVRVAVLEADRDEWRAKAADLHGIEDDYTIAVGNRDAALARVAELGAALQPFADYAKKMGADVYMGGAIGEFYRNGLLLSISFADLAGALEALKGSSS